MNQKSNSTKSQKNPRPPSANTKKDKKPKTPSQQNSETLPKTKTTNRRSVTPLKSEKGSVNNYSKISKKEKSVKINASVNTIDEKEDVALIDLIQEKGNSIMEAKNDKNFNQSFKKNVDFEAKNNIHFASEIKITPNINMINKLINSSHEVLNEQRNILDNVTELNKRLVSSELELQREVNKTENNDFNNFSEKYLSHLNEVVEKLKDHSEEMENIKSN